MKGDKRLCASYTEYVNLVVMTFQLTTISWILAYFDICSLDFLKLAHVCIYPTPLHEQDVTQGQFFKVSLASLNSVFSFSKTGCYTKAEEPSLPYFSTIAGGRIAGFIPFPRLLERCEMQTVLSRIWTQVTISISYDCNHYTCGVMVIVVGNGHGDTSSNPERDWLHFT